MNELVVKCYLYSASIGFGGGLDIGDQFGRGGFDDRFGRGGIDVGDRFGRGGIDDRIGRGGGFGGLRKSNEEQLLQLNSLTRPLRLSTHTSRSVVRIK